MPEIDCILNIPGLKILGIRNKLPLESVMGIVLLFGKEPYYGGP